MKEPDLVSILKTLNPYEIKELEKFIISPFFNKGRNLLPYFKELYKIVKIYDPFKHHQLYFYEKLYPDKEISAKAKAYVNKLSSELLKLVDEYFKCSFYRLNPLSGRLALHEILKEKKLNPYSLKKLPASKKTAADLFNPDIYYHNLFILNNFEASAYLASNRLKEYSGLFEERSLLFTANFLVQFWQEIIHDITFEFQFNRRLNKLNAVKQIISPHIEEKLVDGLKKEKAAGFENAVVFYNISRSFRELGNEKLFLSARDSVLKQMNNFNHKWKFNLLLYLDAIIIFSEKNTGINWNKYRYELYKTMLEKGIYSHNKGQIYYVTYDNFVKVLINAGKYQEAEKFINEHSSLLPLHIKESCENASRAWLYFVKNDFGKALEYNSRIKNEVFNQTIQSKLLEILCHFELKDFEQTLNSYSKAKKYLLENKTMNINSTKQYHNFLHAVKLLTEIQTGQSGSKHKEDLIYFLGSTKIIYRKEWVEKKIR